MMDKQRAFVSQRMTKAIWRVCVVFICAMGMLLNGCGSMPTQSEISAQREESARQDVELLKPGMAYGNFGERALTLRDAIAYALANNLEMRIAKLQEDIQNKETVVEKLRMLPSLRADATWRRRDLLRKSDVYNWLIDEDQEDFTVSELKENAWANLTLTWNVLDTLMAYSRSNISKMEEEVLKRQRTRQEQQLALDVTRAYWHAAAVEDALDYVHVVEDNLKRVKRQLDSAVESRSFDSMAAMDAELRLRELEMTIRQLQANLSKERLELAQLMGLNQNVQFTLARPPIKPIIERLPHTKELNIDRLEEYALLHRPELFASDMQVNIQKEEAKHKVLSMFPGLSIFAGTHYESNRLLLANNWNTVGAGVSLELFELPARYMAYKGQKKAVEMAKVQRMMTTLGVITQVHIALLDYAIKVDRFRVLDQTYALANNLYDMAQRKNQAGALPALAVTQRHLEEMAAKLRRDEAVVDLLVAHKRLCVSLGINPLDCDANGMMSNGGMAANDTAGAMASAGTSGYTYTETTGMKKWRCEECGYIHTGPEPPETCPICGLGAHAFVEVTNGTDQGAAVQQASFNTAAAPATPANYGAALEDDLATWGENVPLMTNEMVGRGEASPGYAGPASDRFLWQVQMGAFVEPGGPTKRINEIRSLTDRILDNRDAMITTKRVHGSLFNRVRVLGLTEVEAKRLARELDRNNMEYWVIAPQSVHW